MNNLQPLKWTQKNLNPLAELELTAYSALHEYEITEPKQGKFELKKTRLSRPDKKSEFLPYFDTVKEAQDWAWSHYQRSMQPYSDTSKYPAQFQEVFVEHDVPESGYGDVRHNCGNGFVVTFRDVPEAITQGDTFIEAVEMAQDALQTAMEFYDEDNKPRPKPSAAIHGDVMIDINSEVQSD
mgnify:CR=1 FL=1